MSRIMPLTISNDLEYVIKKYSNKTPKINWEINSNIYKSGWSIRQNIKTDIYLFVDADDPKNKSGLMSLYGAKYGFILNSETNPSICPFNGTGGNVVAMKKANLVSDTSIINFAFLRKRTPGGGSRYKYSKKTKKMYKKTRRNHRK